VAYLDALAQARYRVAPADAGEGLRHILELHRLDDQDDDPGGRYGEDRRSVEDETPGGHGHEDRRAHPDHDEHEVGREVLWDLDGRPHQPDDGEPEGDDTERQGEGRERRRLRFGYRRVQLALDQVALARDDGVEEVAVTTCNTFDCAACVPLPLGNVIPAVPSNVSAIICSPKPRFGRLVR